MVLLGSLVNAAGIIIGSLLGLLLRRIPESMKQTVMTGIGLFVMVLGLDMALESEQLFIVIISLVFGAVIGEAIDIEKKLHQVGYWLEKKLSKNQTGDFAQGFVSATLIFVIGAMAIVGSLDSGLRQDHDILYTKSMIDGFTSMVLSSTLGIGVLLSAVPVFIYEGAIALFANVIHQYVPDSLLKDLISEITAVGGILIFAIGINMLAIKAIRVANLLPSLAVVAVIIVFMNIV
ncbi:DUF554 domain-containing protein [Metabacillus idriensis]|uniref:DUF554 family protein n=1 Tax=Metabacillus idriensis TaxID=324768 RepID=A0A6I2M714_9BACI|nr:DUF554 domain-containing protein [Metabacillus idriensis]MCM3597252.1 DUF554 domain-containing protein [Metabacillus idriensis]MRX54005.1 DUF554 family protein [Metabacillus idriensis]OHR73145.1 hypothetical protein HMPREF3291_20340 [Bacillus sp. HMSC76G11]